MCVCCTVELGYQSHTLDLNFCVTLAEKVKTVWLFPELLRHSILCLFCSSWFSQFHFFRAVFVSWSLPHFAVHSPGPSFVGSFIIYFDCSIYWLIWLYKLYLHFIFESSSDYIFHRIKCAFPPLCICSLFYCCRCRSVEIMIKYFHCSGNQKANNILWRYYIFVRFIGKERGIIFGDLIKFHRSISKLLWHQLHSHMRAHFYLIFFQQFIPSKNKIDKANESLEKLMLNMHIVLLAEVGREIENNNHSISWFQFRVYRTTNLYTVYLLCIRHTQAPGLAVKFRYFSYIITIFGDYFIIILTGESTNARVCACFIELIQAQSLRSLLK